MARKAPSLTGGVKRFAGRTATLPFRHPYMTLAGAGILWLGNEQGWTLNGTWDKFTDYLATGTDIASRELKEIKEKFSDDGAGSGSGVSNQDATMTHSISGETLQNNGITMEQAATMESVADDTEIKRGGKTYYVEGGLLVEDINGVTANVYMYDSDEDGTLTSKDGLISDHDLQKEYDKQIAAGKTQEEANQHISETYVSMRPATAFIHPTTKKEVILPASFDRKSLENATSGKTALDTAKDALATPFEWIEKQLTDAGISDEWAGPMSILLGGLGISKAMGVINGKAPIDASTLKTIGLMFAVVIATKRFFPEFYESLGIEKLPDLQEIQKDLDAQYVAMNQLKVEEQTTRAAIVKQYLKGDELDKYTTETNAMRVLSARIEQTVEHRTALRNEAIKNLGSKSYYNSLSAHLGIRMLGEYDPSSPSGVAKNDLTVAIGGGNEAVLIRYDGKGRPVLTDTFHALSDGQTKNRDLMLDQLHVALRGNYSLDKADLLSTKHGVIANAAWKNGEVIKVDGEQFTLSVKDDVYTLKPKDGDAYEIATVKNGRVIAGTDFDVIFGVNDGKLDADLHTVRSALLSLSPKLERDQAFTRDALAAITESQAMESELAILSRNLDATKRTIENIEHKVRVNEPEAVRELAPKEQLYAAKMKSSQQNIVNITGDLAYYGVVGSKTITGRMGEKQSRGKQASAAAKNEVLQSFYNEVPTEDALRKRMYKIEQTINENPQVAAFHDNKKMVEAMDNLVIAKFGSLNPTNKTAAEVNDVRAQGLNQLAMSDPKKFGKVHRDYLMIRTINHLLDQGAQDPNSTLYSSAQNATTQPMDVTIMGVSYHFTNRHDALKQLAELIAQTERDVNKALGKKPREVEGSREFLLEMEFNHIAQGADHVVHTARHSQITDQEREMFIETRDMLNKSSLSDTKIAELLESMAADFNETKATDGLSYATRKALADAETIIQKEALTVEEKALYDKIEERLSSVSGASSRKDAILDAILKSFSQTARTDGLSNDNRHAITSYLYDSDPNISTKEKKLVQDISVNKGGSHAGPFKAVSDLIDTFGKTSGNTTVPDGIINNLKKALTDNGLEAEDVDKFVDESFKKTNAGFELK